MAAQAIVDHQSQCRLSLHIYQRDHQRKHYPSNTSSDNNYIHCRSTPGVEKPVSSSSPRHTVIRNIGSCSYSPISQFTAGYHQPEAVLASVCHSANGEMPSGGEQLNGYNCRRRSTTVGYQPHRSSAALECIPANWKRNHAANDGHHIPSETAAAGQLVLVRRKPSDDGTSYRVVHQQQQPGSLCSAPARSHGMANRRDRYDCIIQPPHTTEAATPTRYTVDHCSWSPVDLPRRRVNTMTSSTGYGPKLSRAVSEYSLHGHGRQFNGDRTVDEDEKMHFGDVSWRSVTDDDPPPRIAPISGQLSKAASQTIIRPIPFKLVQGDSHHGAAAPYGRRSSGPSDASTSTPANSRLSTDEGYASSSRSYFVGVGGSGNRSSSSDDASNSLAALGTDSRTMIVDAVTGCNSSPDVDDNEHRRRFSQSQEGDRLRRQSSSECSGSLPSGVIGDADRNMGAGSATVSAATLIKELESALRGKETELRRLRNTMEQNETAIVEVLQERRRSWQAQMTSLSAEWERKLRCEQQKSFRTEQALMLQVFRLQQDNRELTQQQQPIGRGRVGSGTEVSDDKPLRREYSEQNGNLDELSAARSRLDEIRWELDERTGEVSSLLVRIASADSRAAELEAELRVERQRAADAVDRADEASRRSSAAERDRDAALETVDQLRTDLEHVKELANRERVEFDRERERWLDEKRRVIDYQKQLQLNYVQMARKNRLLELNVQQLTAEIERQSNSRSSPPHSSGAITTGRGLSAASSSELLSNVVRISDESMC